ncbi:hypothetical protein DER44DRAFT_827856 [Fusarium oxysporum]|nr:hypothetical protein DER44DRAFT_827856 [Fusarium oxysporum]
MEDVLEQVNDESMADDDLLKPIDATEALKGSAPFEALITRALKRNTWKMIKDPYHRAVLVGSSNVVEALKKRGVNPTSRVYSLLPAALPVIKNTYSALTEVQVHEKADGLGRVCIRSKRCVPPPLASNKHFYFEVTVLKDSNSRIPGLGFCGEDIGGDQMPGWFDGSWAYHGDDGKLFIESGYGVVSTPDFGAPGEFGAGDVVDACLNLEMGEGFCTLNGNKMNMGYASERTKFKVVKMYPCIGIHTKGVWDFNLW